jgi:hypothetical protein
MLPIVEAVFSAVSVSVPFLIGTEVSLLLNVTRDCKLGAIVVEDDKFDCEGLLLLLLDKRRL